MTRRLLLHTCCAPCFLHPERSFTLEWKVTAYFCNPNIHPRWEWAKRRDQLEEYCEEGGLGFESVEYAPNTWSKKVLTGREDPVPERCRRCYRLRLEATAERAAAAGFDAFSTTLLVSPHQDHEAVVDEGCEAADRHSVRFLDDDLRDGYKWGVGRSKELEMYRQDYCGCVLSLVERGQRRRIPERKRTRAGR